MDLGLWCTKLPMIQHSLELVSFILARLLWFPRLPVLCDSNMHAEDEVSGPALEFLKTIVSLDMSQPINCPTCMSGHTLSLDLYFLLCRE